MSACGEGTHPPPVRRVPRAAVRLPVPRHRQGGRRPHALSAVLQGAPGQHACASPRANLCLPVRCSKGVPLTAKKSNRRQPAKKLARPRGRVSENAMVSRSGKRQSADYVRRAARDAAKRQLDRYIERWARRLLLVDRDGVRRLTEEEVQAAVGGKKRNSRTRSPGRKGSRKR
jgi:hypothetical protein